MQLIADELVPLGIREVVIPEVDSYTYSVLCSKVGHKPEARALIATKIYTKILAPSEQSDPVGIYCGWISCRASWLQDRGQNRN